MENKILNLKEKTPIKLKIKSIAISVTAKDTKEARLGAQMFMRKRYQMELDRDYRIIKTLQVKQNNISN